LRAFGLLSAIALCLMGCAGPHEVFVAEAHDRYERSLDLGSGVAAPAEPYRARRLPPRRRSVVTGSTPTFRLAPLTPRTGTPEWQREQDYSERREGELRRQIQSICAPC
jgi:hypothetical protein